MSQAGIARIHEAIEALRKDLPGVERMAETRRADLEKAETKLYAYRRTIAAYEADIAKIEMADRLTRIYGKDPRTAVL